MNKGYNFLKKMVFILLVGAAITSCATIFTGTSDSVMFSSTPSGGKVYVDGAYSGTTPVEVSLKRDNDYNIVVKKEGYNEATAILKREFNPVTIVNLIFVLGWVVDFVDGAAWKFGKKGIHIEFDKKTSFLHHGKILLGKNMIQKMQGKRTAILWQSAPAY